MPKQPARLNDADSRLLRAARRAPPTGPQRGAAPGRPVLLTITEKERLQRRIQADEEIIRQARGEDTEGVGEIFLGPTQSYGAFSVATVQKRLRRNKETLQRMDPANHRFTGVERQRAHTRIREIEEKLRKMMLTTYEMGAYPKKDHGRDGDYRRACEKSFRQEVGNPEFQRLAQEHKHLARRLDPDSPELANIERLRARRRY